MKNWKKYILIFVSSLLFFLIIGAPLRGIIGFIYASIIETICYAILTYFILKKYSKTITDSILFGGLILSGRIILEIPLRIRDFEATLISLPNTLLVCITLFLTILLFLSKKKKQVLFFSLIIWGYCVFEGHRNVLEYLTWGTTPDVNIASFPIRTKEKNATLSSIEDEYILLDFWNSKCGVCYKKFPLLQSLFERVEKGKAEVTIASVFVPSYKNEQEETGIAIIDSLGYTFPAWSITKQDTLLKVLAINGYPTVVLLDKSKNVIYKGSLEMSIKKLEKLVNLK